MTVPSVCENHGITGFVRFGNALDEGVTQEAQKSLESMQDGGNGLGELRTSRADRMHFARTASSRRTPRWFHNGAGYHRSTEPYTLSCCVVAQVRDDFPIGLVHLQQLSVVEKNS